MQGERITVIAHHLLRRRKYDK